MKSRVLKISLVVAVVCAASVNLLNTGGKAKVTDLTMKNIEALGKGFEDGLLYPGYKYVEHNGPGQASCTGNGYLFCV